ncbi:hypothetical protein LOK74_08005 [Brevibacillus humidisoli]|uniref:3-oxoacyl-[acyl-carrier-protein] synthase III C-terminal domain-containing protein n=1 Tax=Brevibacillus humidisoli TaxID=2895522 RepID=UPI001E3A5DFA|nr:3-oxoacyl-[acyl-carrier-protein] synthase III C-terminal domain-containing protein [Brevibacillus humidisoli]UFJ42418.1 hypothetical protein LOK74_08005 [Brevibacillus humidisoli]
MLYLKHVSVNVPQSRMTLEQIRDLDGIETTDVEALKRRGYTSVPVDEADTSLDLIGAVLDQLLSQSEIHPRQVRYVIMPYLYNAFPYKYDMSGELRKRYGLSRATFFSVRDLLCSNWLMGLKVGGTLLERSDDEDDVIILLTCEKAYLPDLRYGGVYFVVGDAAAAAVIGRTGPGDEILSVHNVTDIRTFALRDPHAGQVIVQDYSYFISMSRMIRRCLQQADTSLTEVKLFIPTNTITETWENLAKVMKLSPERFFTKSLYTYGHTNNCDLLLNYDWVVNRGGLQPGERYAFVSIGSGGAIGCAVCRKG